MFTASPTPGASCRCRFLPGAGPCPAEMQIQSQTEEINPLSAKHLHFPTTFSLSLHSTHSIPSVLDNPTRAARALVGEDVGRMFVGLFDHSPSVL